MSSPTQRDGMATLAAAAEDPQAYAERWKRDHGRPVIGVFPMNFPVELIHAAGALPVVVQEDRAPITAGRNLLYEYYCAYTRSIADQAATAKLGVFDAFFFVDHCVALIGAVDAMRFELPDTPILLADYTASMDEPWTPPEIRRKVDGLRAEVEAFTGAAVTDDALRHSIALFNENRRLLREVYARRRSGEVQLTSTQVQTLVKSSMVMDVGEHTRILRDLIEELSSESTADTELIRLHLSGHFCHAPHPELLETIESCGAIVVDDDLYTGLRYIATDVPEAQAPCDALARWYFERNVTVPCATRVQNDVDWDAYLLTSLRLNRAQGVVVLMAKFCEPHMLYYPELRRALDREGIPHLLIETEHEGLPAESLSTRVETFLELIRRRPAPAVTSA